MTPIEFAVSMLERDTLKLQRAFYAFEDARVKFDAAEKAYDEALEAQNKTVRDFTQSLTARWLDKKLAPLSVGEQQKFVEELASTIHPVSGCDLQPLMDEIWGKGNLAVFAGHPNEPDADDAAVKERGESLLRMAIHGELTERFKTVCKVWREEPNADETYEQERARLKKWLVALEKTHEGMRKAVFIFVHPEIFEVLRIMGRIKKNGKKWADFCFQDYSFVSTKAINSDIAKAIRGIEANNRKLAAEMKKLQTAH